MQASRMGPLAQPSPIPAEPGVELVTNAVLHARTTLTLTLELRPGVARIGVRDHSPATLAVRNYSPEAVTGRGLGVVATPSRTWGMVADGGGKLVWAEFELDQ